ncbi:hypothetical protein C8J56DRAFT_929181 [Mycena floridula]|nr:hypothetical protein C8J56DRAFT_929181 [Mycena floridula]
MMPAILSSEPHLPSKLSGSLTSVITCTVLMLGLMYFGSLFLIWRYAVSNPRFLNKESGILIHRYAPATYIAVVLCSFVEFALSIWLILQYQYQTNYPNKGTRDGVGILLFCSCWTILTATLSSICFIHPSWSKLAVASVGAQFLWAFGTWILWIAGSALLNHSLPSLLVRGSCAGITYCGQIRAAFAFSVVQILILTCANIAIGWLVWSSARDRKVTL